MSKKWRRFEVMLPRQFNDGREVPSEWIAKAVLEIGDHFGAVSYETQVIEATGGTPALFIATTWRVSSSMFRTKRNTAPG